MLKGNYWKLAVKIFWDFKVIWGKKKLYKVVLEEYIDIYAKHSIGINVVEWVLSGWKLNAAQCTETPSLIPTSTIICPGLEHTIWDYNSSSLNA